MCITVRSSNKVFHKSTFLYHWFGNVYFAKKQPTKEKKKQKKHKTFFSFQSSVIQRTKQNLSKINIYILETVQTLDSV